MAGPVSFNVWALVEKPPFLWFGLSQSLVPTNEVLALSTTAQIFFAFEGDTPSEELPSFQGKRLCRERKEDRNRHELEDGLGLQRCVQADLQRAHDQLIEAQRLSQTGSFMTSLAGDEYY